MTLRHTWSGGESYENLYLDTLGKMPGLPLVVRETTTFGCSCRYSRMCRQQSLNRLTAEEALAAEEHLSIYCKPVELYNILQRRAIRNPSFLQRCLHYKIQAKRKRRSRSGTILFNYLYYNNMLQKTEVTEDFSCPFCSVQCASIKGLRYHLISSHDLFNFEFWVTEEFQAVNVSVQTDIWRSEVASDGVDPRSQPFFYRSKFKRRRKSKNLVQNVNHVHPHVLELDSPEPAREGSHEDYTQKDNGTYSSHRSITYPTVVELPNGLNDYSNKEESSKALFDGIHLLSGRHNLESENHLAAEFKEPVTSSPDTGGVCATARSSISNDCVKPVRGSNLGTPTRLKFAKRRKLSVERADPRNRALLKKRQFFHSRRAQPMTLEQVFSDRDSEDDVDEDIQDFTDGRMLDDFVDVTKDEKQIMHLWNSFVRKQRVLADGHIPWACEAFSRLHGRDLVRAPALLWCWRLFMVKLWNHGLLDARTMNNCNLILEKYQEDDLDPKQS